MVWRKIWNEWFCFITSILILNFYLYFASQESCIGIVKDLLESFVGKRFEANIFSSEMMEDPDKTKLLDPVWFSSFQIYRFWFNLTKNVKNLWSELKIDRVNHVESNFVQKSRILNGFFIISLPHATTSASCRKE